MKMSALRAAVQKALWDEVFLREADCCQGLAAVRVNTKLQRPFSSIVPEAAEAKGAVGTAGSPASVFAKLLVAVGSM